eukprot:403345168
MVNNRNEMGSNPLREISNNQMQSQQQLFITKDDSSSLERKVQTKWVPNIIIPTDTPHLSTIEYQTLQQSSEIQAEIINDLKSNLQQETSINQDLRNKLENLARQHLNEKEQNENDKNLLNNKLQQVNQTLSQLMQENISLKKQSIYLDRSNKELTHKTSVYQSQIQNLRAFVVHLTNDLDGHKKKDFRQTQFWKALQADQVIQDSEPPNDYPTPIDCNDKNIFIVRQDLERLQHENKKYLNDLKSLTAKLESTQESLKKQTEKKNQLKKESNQLITQMKNQLLGAVRRINYLVEEKRKAEEENTKRSKYTAKLELKIVQENLNNKGLRQRVQNLQDNIQDSKVREQLQEFDFKYNLQGSNIMEQSQKIASTNSTAHKRPSSNLRNTNSHSQIPIHNQRRGSQSKLMNSNTSNKLGNNNININASPFQLGTACSQEQLIMIPQSVQSPIMSKKKVNSGNNSRSQSRNHTQTIQKQQLNSAASSTTSHHQKTQSFTQSQTSNHLATANNNNNHTLNNNQVLSGVQSHINILSECMSQSDQTNHYNQNLYQPAILNTANLNGNANQSQQQQQCNFQDMQSIEEMFASMDRQVQAYYQLQKNIDELGDDEQQHNKNSNDFENLNMPRSLTKDTQNHQPNYLQSYDQNQSTPHTTHQPNNLKYTFNDIQLDSSKEQLNLHPLSNFKSQNSSNSQLQNLNSRRSQVKYAQQSHIKSSLPVVITSMSNSQGTNSYMNSHCNSQHKLQLMQVLSEEEGDEHDYQSETQSQNEGLNQLISQNQIKNQGYVQNLDGNNNNFIMATGGDCMSFVNPNLDECCTDQDYQNHLNAVINGNGMIMLDHANVIEENTEEENDSTINY